MRNRTWLCAALCASMALFAGCAGAPTATPTPSTPAETATPGASADADADEARAQKAKVWLQQFFAKDAAAEEALADQMKTALASQGGLKALQDTMAANGDVVSMGEPTYTSQDGYLVVVVPVAFANNALDAQISLDASDKVAGLYFNAPAGDADAQAKAAKAHAMLVALFAGDYEAAAVDYSDAVKAQLDAQGGLSAIADALEAQCGAMTEIGAIKQNSTAAAGTTIVYPIAFEKASLDAYVSIDASGKIIGMQFLPVVEAPEAVVPENVTEEAVTVDAGTGFPLEGNISLPKDATGKLPAVVLAWGSGANDRDETIGANRIFAQVAHGLSQRGYLVLRFDKRTNAYPATWNEPGFTVQDEYIDDMLAAVKMLKADDRVDPARVFLLGHSEGGALAPRIDDAGADVAGLILMAGTPRLLSDVLYDQEMDVMRTLRAQATTDEAKKVADAQQAQYDAWKAETEALYAMTDEQARAHAALYGGTFPAYYMYDMAKAKQPIDLLLQNQTPVLVLQGDKDLQVYPDKDFAMYKEALEGKDFATLKLYEGLSHCFLPSQASVIGESMQEYNTPLTIPAQVLDDMDAFMKGVK